MPPIIASSPVTIIHAILYCKFIFIVIIGIINRPLLQNTVQPYNNHHTTLGTGLCPSHTQNQLYSSGNFQTSCQNLIVMASIKVVAGIVVYEWIDNKKLYTIIGTIAWFE